MFVRLGLERLDARNAPSSVVGNAVASADWLPPPDATGQMPAYVGPDVGGSGAQPVPNGKPVINNFTVVLLNGGVARYSGTVSDENPAGLSVQITGAQGCLGDGRTVTTDAEGYFEWDGAVRPTVDTGLAYADVSDAQGLEATTAESYLTV
jgi:hypothetical protein